jgi:hypothetical protein
MTARKNSHMPQWDLTKGTIPVVIVASLMGFIAFGSYQVSSIISSLRADKEAADVRFAGIERDLAAIRTLLEKSNYITPAEFIAWCAVTEALNKGWKCGSTLALGKGQ